MANMIIPTKPCKICKQEFPATTEYFHRQSGGKYGLHSMCKPCRAIHRRDIERRHYHKHRDKKLAYSKSYALEHHEAVLEYSHVYNIVHAEEKREYMRNYFVPDKPFRLERKRANSRKFSKAHPDRVLANRNRHRARKLELPSSFTNEDWQQALEYFGGCCAVCGRPPDFWRYLAQDHFIPLSDPRPDNPGTVAWNIIPLCHSRSGAPVGDIGCNLSKGNKNPEIWLISKFGKRKAKAILKRISEYLEAARKVAA
jgi:hypothetical protein